MTNDNPSPIDLHETARGVVFAVRAQPSARRNAILGVHATALKVAVTAAADKGKANEAILSLLAAELQLPRSRIAIVSGETSRQKKLAVRDIEAGELARRLAAVLP